MEYPSRLEENLELLMSELNTLKDLRNEVIRRSIRGKDQWLKNVEAKGKEVDNKIKEWNELENYNSGNRNARFKLNKEVLEVIQGVKVLQGGHSAPSDSIGTLLRELAIDKLKKFSHGDLRSITKYFTHAIGSGAFGVVYMGQFDNGVKVAVKVLSEKDLTEDMFMAEVSTMGRTYHRYLITLYGFCFDENMKALVYEYMENKSLDKILYEHVVELDWEKLYDIAIETAKGLAYLHEGCHQQIIHHDVKAGNVLLDSKFSPRVTDFGLAKLMDRDKTHLTLTRTRGTPGYAAPEMWIPSSKITCKCDVYSFGILLFEILGRRSISQSDKWFPREVWKKFETGQLENIIKDCEIGGENIEKAKALSRVAFWCIQFAPERRPSMSTVVMMLEKPIIIDEPPDPFPQVVSTLTKVSSGLFSESLLKQIYPEKSSNSVHNRSTPDRNVSIREEQKGAPTKVSASQNPRSSHGTNSDSLLESFEKRCPPGGENSVIIYTTSLGVTKSFDKCKEVLSILRSHRVELLERDLYADPDYKMELRGLLGRIELPSLFVKGRFIGGADEMMKMDEEGKLNVLFDDVNKK